MRRIVILLFSFGMIIALAACGQSAASEKQEEIQSAVQKTEEQSETPQNGAAAEQAETEEQEASLKEKRSAERRVGKECRSRW